MSGRATAERVDLTSLGGALTVAVDRIGARISSIILSARSSELLLHTPWEDEEWGDAYPSGRSSEEWHRRYPGGWHTLIPHTGDPRDIDGVTHPFHGEAAWRRWRLVERTERSCIFEIVLRTVPFRVRRQIDLSDAGVEIAQSVQNLSGDPIAFSWTEHPAFGSALIGPDTTLWIGGDRIDAIFPEVGERHGGFQTVDVNGRGSAQIRNESARLSATLHWDPAVFPYLYVWQEHHDGAGFPWWGRTNVVALEPASRPYEPAKDALGPLVVPGDGLLATRFALDVDAF